MKINLPEKKEETIWIMNRNGSAAPLSKFNEESESNWETPSKSFRTRIKVKADYSRFE